MREEAEVLRTPVFCSSEEILSVSSFQTFLKNPSAVLKITLKTHLRCSLLGSVSLCYGHLTYACVFKAALNNVSRADQENLNKNNSLFLSFVDVQRTALILMFFARDL